MQLLGDKDGSVWTESCVGLECKGAGGDGDWGVGERGAAAINQLPVVWDGVSNMDVPRTQKSAGFLGITCAHCSSGGCDIERIEIVTHEATYYYLYT